MTLPAGQRVRHWRELKGISQLDLAERAKMGNTKLCKIESGAIKNPSAADVETLAAALGLTMGEFYGTDDAARDENVA